VAGPPIEVLLTRLVGLGDVSPGKLAAIDAETWEAIDARAAEHRCQPVLHRRLGSVPNGEAVPASIRDRWAGAFRHSALVTLAQRADLQRVCDRLAAQGIVTVALKGSWLAWTCYSEPAQRPMRDLDILVPADRALEARTLLLDDGWNEPATDGLAAADWLERFKHLPPLVAPSGTVVELHTRLWDDDGRMPPAPQGLFERSRLGGGERPLRFLHPVDNFMHLAVHAAFHRFDGGPLMLLDCALFRPHAGDEPDLIWQRAAREGWERHAALFVQAADRWMDRGIAERLRCPVGVPDELVEQVPFLLAKPLAARARDIAAAKLARADLSFARKAQRVWARRERYASTGEWLGWVGSELSGATRNERGTTLAALDRWLLG
jgi:hypothetical protein